MLRLKRLLKLEGPKTPYFQQNFQWNPWVFPTQPLRATKSERTQSVPINGPGGFFLCSGSATIQRRKTTVPEARYRLFRRASGMYYQQDHETGVQVSLRTKDKHAAQEKLRAANESVAQPRLNLDLARVYLKAHDAEIANRTWAMVMTVYSARGRDTSQQRCQRAFAGQDFDPIRNLLLINTKAEDLLRVLATGKASVNHYLRRLVHHAEDLNWLPWIIMAKAAWPKVKKNSKRGITAEEHQRILEAEKSNPERRAYYQMLWMTGGSQGDIARLRAENIDSQVLAYRRGKLPEDAPSACQRVGPTMQQLLDALPKSGWLFPKIAQQKSKDRASEFYRRCKLLQIKNVTLHSYRYAWAGRAAQAGFPQRFAQAALGHQSPAVTESYQRHAVVTSPSLEEYEAHQLANVVPFPPPLTHEPKEESRRAINT